VKTLTLTNEIEITIMEFFKMSMIYVNSSTSQIKSFHHEKNTNWYFRL